MDLFPRPMGGSGFAGVAIENKKGRKRFWLKGCPF
jgi:hypothetical protein